MKPIRAIALFLLIPVLTACMDGTYYHHSVNIPTSGWERNLTLYFQDSLMDNEPDTMHMEITLRHTNLYPYQNIWLYFIFRTSEGTVRKDSLNVALCDANGRWTGEGFGSLYTQKRTMKDLSIQKGQLNRWFVIEVQHGLKDESLKGISDIGIRLFSDSAGHPHQSAEK